MICYKDMTFCSFYKDCKEGLTCGRALTEEVRKEAKKWFGSDDAPICQFVHKPDCWKQPPNEQGEKDSQ